VARLLIALAVLAGALLVPAPAYAAADVTVSPGSIDPTYATTITVSGSGFQAVKGGHGGIYVFFGTVKQGWQPSKGGRTGSDYFYVPDSEAKANQGFQRYVAFPGSDTADSANGGVMSASGGWSTQLVVPGATFQAYDRDGEVTTVDCRTVTCGVITVGAHGVTSSRNETFTPVSVAKSTSTPGATATAEPTGTAEPTAEPTADPTAAPSPGSAGTPQPAGPVTLEVDRASAVAGNVLAFHATGLPPGTQVSAVFDDGASGAGPFVAGADGTLAGVVTLPGDTGAGTHELRLYGVEEAPSVSFAVQPAEVVEEPADDVAAEADDERAAWLFAGAAALVLLLALARLGVRARKVRRAKP
jgi:hypothetical protein